MADNNISIEIDFMRERAFKEIKELIDKKKSEQYVKLTADEHRIYCKQIDEIANYIKEEFHATDATEDSLSHFDWWTLLP